MNIQTRKITITAILASICLLLGLTPLGYIPIGPIVMTLMCIPVIIGTLLEGIQTGLILGLVFGITSFLKTVGFSMVPDFIGMWLFNTYPLQAVLTIFIPRLLIPVVVWLMYRLLKGAYYNGSARDKINIGITAFIGSITNTVFFLGSLYVLLLPNADALAAQLKTTSEGLLGTIAAIGASNGLPEAALAVILSIPIVLAIKKIKSKKNKEITGE